MRIWAQVPLALSAGAVSKICARSSVDFLSALRECDARAGLVPPRLAVTRSHGRQAIDRLANDNQSICSFELSVTRGCTYMHAQ
jgi:hypothetical protein